MKTEKIKQEIDRLSISQRLLLAQHIWDSIAKENDKLPMPQWQKTELDKRHEQYKQGELSLHDWQDVHKHIRAKGK